MDRFSRYETQKIKKQIYEKVAKLTSMHFRDSGWNGKDKIIEAINSVYGVLEVIVTVIDGGYRTNRYGEQRKEWVLEITTYRDTIINGLITAYQAGSVKDPWDAYDLTVVLD